MFSKTETRSKMDTKHYIIVNSGPDEAAALGADLFAALVNEARDRGVEEQVQIVLSGAFGPADTAPSVTIKPEDTFYSNVAPESAAEIIEQHVVKGAPSKELMAEESGRIKHARQCRIVLRNCGVIDPNSIDEYIARRGYEALGKAIHELKPDGVIEEMRKSQLRGRGGAGFPTWRKWLFSKDVEAEQKYVICNADEGDPGAYMDRSTLEGDPHSILEAMAICGFAVGATQGVIYIRAEYPLAISRLKNAIAQAKEYGLLGEDIMGSGFNFDIDLRLGAGAFVCGEETALIASAEGERGMPTPRPPFPAVKGMWGKPTVINNVETWANIPVIILKGGDWFADIGTETSKGTKVFALTGKVNTSGLIEVPMGTTLREVIFDIGGGIPGGAKFKAVQTGGPSGGVIPESLIDTPIDYEGLQKLGSIMGSGGMIVMDENDCMVDVSKFYLEFTVDESCGKCAPCRIGGRTLYNLLCDVSAGRADDKIIAKMRDVSTAMQRASLCGLGQTAPNPVLSVLEHFGEEFMAHIDDKRCPAGVCKDLVTFNIIPDKCIGCTVCARRCPVNCISGGHREVHVIDQSRCIKCGECFTACKFGAVERV
jgi:NADP-reducing hydrogenase subunit HndC